MSGRIMFIFLLGLGLISCGQDTENSKNQDVPEAATAEKPVTTPAEQDKGALYVSEDGTFRLRVMSDHDNDPETIRLRDEGTGNDYVLNHVAAASGVKYENDQGYFFWTKGEEFMWGKGGETLQQGKMRK